jgi:hypothetical protein
VKEKGREEWKKIEERECAALQAPPASRRARWAGSAKADGKARSSIHPKISAFQHFRISAFQHNNAMKHSQHDPRNRKAPDEDWTESCDFQGCDCSDEMDLISDELADYTESMARSQEDGWFYSDEDPDAFFG